LLEELVLTANIDRLLFWEPVMSASLKSRNRVAPRGELEPRNLELGQGMAQRPRQRGVVLIVVCVTAIVQMQMMLSGCGGSSYGGVKTPTPPSSGHFSTLAPGTALPSESDCAAQVRRSSFEPRPDNATANNTNVYAQGGRLTGSYLNQYGYESRVTGNFTGTTDEIIQWGACKWGIDEDIVRAQSVQESYWHQSTLGDCNGGPTVSQTHGCASVGLLQVKGADIPPTHPGTWPYAYQSTAFNADYMLGVLRACYEGKETWLGNGYQAGDIWGCVGRWFSGDWYINSRQYIASVQGIEAQKVWLSAGF
jgi:autotransporter family porin